MRISVIGAGRVATHLALALAPHHPVCQIHSRDLGKAQQLATQVGATAINTFDALNSAVDVVVVAVSDHAIAAVVAAVHAVLPEVLCVHTSGSTDIAVIQQHHPRAGVFYPLQTFSLGSEIDWQHTPLFVEAAQETDQAMLLQLAQQLSQRVYQYTSAQRLSLHLAAVFACNFSNYCYDMAKQIVDADGVDFDLLHPLILETARKATLADPKHMQTGPAVRGDANILAMHQQLLQHSGHGDLQQLYALLSKAIATRHA